MKISPLYLSKEDVHTSSQFGYIRDRVLSPERSISHADFHYLCMNVIAHGSKSLYDLLIDGFGDLLEQHTALRRLSEFGNQYFNGLSKTLGGNFEERIDQSFLSMESMHLKGVNPSRRITIVFRTVFNNALISNPLLASFLDRAESDVLFIPGLPFQSILRRGVLSIARDADSLIKNISEFCIREGYDEIDILGASSGTFAALVFGESLGARNINLFSFYIPEGALEALELPSASKVLSSYKNISNGRGKANVSVYSGDINKADLEHLNFFNGMSNVDKFVVRKAGHLCALKLIARGEFLNALSRTGT